MSLTDIEKVRLNTGDRAEPYLITDGEIEYFLNKYSQNIEKASVEIAKCILFFLAANPSAYRERTGDEEVYTADSSKAYKEALLAYIKNPQFFLDGIRPFAAGLTAEGDPLPTPDNSCC